MKRILSTMLCLTLMNSTTQLVASAEQTPFNLTSEEQLLLDEMLDTLGYDSIDDLLRTRVAMPTVDRIKDLNGDGVLDLSDANFILRFLKGDFDYDYQYNDMDANSDYLVDATDAEEYLAYYVHYCITNSTIAPFSAPGEERTPDNNYEVRTYIKHMYDPSSGIPDTTYTLSIPDYEDVINNTRSQPATASNTVVNQYVRERDTRIVRCAGSGFIVGKHVIATNAHCVYNYETGLYDTSSAVTAFTYNEDGTSVPHNLTPVSVHVPLMYSSTTISDNDRVGWDYALIIVEEDLSSYGYFGLGVLLEGASKLNDGQNSSGMPVSHVGFAEQGSEDDANDEYNLRPDGHREYPGITYGELNNFNDNRYTTTAWSSTGSSGGPTYTITSRGQNENDTVIGIHNSAVSNSTSRFERAVVITRPVLQFLLDNPYDPGKDE